VDSSDTVIFGPTTQPAASSITLTDVPITVVKLRIEYLGNGVVIGLFETPVTVPAGGTVTLTDPAWTDVAPQAVSYTSTNLSLVSGAFPTSVAAGDFNKDGNLDLAVAQGNLNDAWVFWGNGSGGFPTASSLTLSTGASFPAAVATGDFNKDGNLDLAVVNGGSNDVSVLLNDGTGGFPVAASVGTGVAPFSVAVGDLDGDGNLDLAVANYTSNDVSVLQGDGTGNFVPFPGSPLATGGNSPISVAIGDLDGDGNLDLAVANNTSNDVSVLQGDGTGNFVPFPGSPLATGGNAPGSVAIGDLDGDGNLDLAVTNGLSDTVSVLQGDGTGNFTLSTTPSTGDGPFFVAAGDLNGDNRPDLAVANTVSNEVSVLLGKGDGTFVTSASFVTGNNPRWLALGDLNGDGKADLAVANSSSDTVSLLLRL
jgi:hypothetical protein